MNLITRKSDSLVWLQTSSEIVQADGVYVVDGISVGISVAENTIIENAAPLTYGKFFPQTYTYNGTWGIGNQEFYDTQMSVFNGKLKADKIAEIEKAYKEFSSLPISYMETTFQADADSQALIAQVLTACGGVLPQGFMWYDANNAPVTMSYAQLQGLAGVILLRGQQHFTHKQTLKAFVRSATTTTDVEGVTW